MIGARYKDFPPGWDHLKVPTSSRQAALAALTMYSACRPRAVWLQRAAWLSVRMLGPRSLPGPAHAWTPPVDGQEGWGELSSAMAAALGRFDEIAGYVRVQTERRGMALLLLERGRPVAFVKMRQGDATPLLNEARALSAVADFGPRTFRVPEVLHAGFAAGWHFLAVSPLPAQLHRAPSGPPIHEILREVRAALAEIPRAADVPPGWDPMHGDFAPWNLRRTWGGDLYLLDWESAGWGPPSADEVFYLATTAALAERPAPLGPSAEAARFWRSQIRQQPEDARDRRLAASLRQALDCMAGPSNA